MVTRYIMSSSAVLAPGEIRDLSVEPAIPFRAERLIIAEVPRSKVQFISTWLCSLPLTIVENLLAFFSDQPGPGWKLPRYFPMKIVQFKIGACKQFSSSPLIPAEVFASHRLDPLLDFDTCPAGQKLTVTVQSEAQHPFTCQLAIIGAG